MRPRWIAFVGFGLTLLASGSWPDVARGDGGTLRAWQRLEHCEIAVFTEPSPFAVGPVDISVLVLDPTTGEPIPGARVTVGVTPEGRPDLVTRHPATTDAASNKLLHAAVFELRHAGRCEVEVDVVRSADHARLRFGLDVASRSTPSPGVWLWILMPAPVIAVYGAHRWLVGRRRTEG